MGQSSSTCSGEDWPHEGCSQPVLAAGDSGEQSKAGARQRDSSSSPRCHEGTIQQLEIFPTKPLNLRVSRLVFHTMSKSALAGVNHIVSTILLFSSRTLPIHYMELPFASGPARTKSVQRPFETLEKGRKRTSMTRPRRLTGSHTV